MKIAIKIRRNERQKTQKFDGYLFAMLGMPQIQIVFK